MERKELETLGLDKEAIDKVLNLHHAELDPLRDTVKTKDEEIKTLTEDTKSTKEQLDELEKKASGNEELEKAFNDLKIEAEKKEAQYKSDIDKRDFEKVLIDEITKRGGKSVVKQLISYDEFKESNDRTSDISKKLDELKTAEDTRVLFEPSKVDDTNVGGGKIGDGKPNPIKEMPTYI